MVDFAKMLQQRRDSESPSGIPGKQFTTQVSISIAASDYALSFGYDAALLQKLKAAIPEYDRTWHKREKVWLIAPESIDKAIEAIKSHTGKSLALPEDKPVQLPALEKTFQLDYLGATKDRGPRKTAYGSVNGDWASEFPEEILKTWFEGAVLTPEGQQTLYQVLCVPESAPLELIKKAYKRLALQNHPDVCKEEGAHELFIKINEAYKILIDPEQKKRYDAGLYFERESKNGQLTRVSHRFDTYRSPLRCGQITARGTIRLMRFVVSEILKWEDVINADGKVMTSSWPKGADTFEIRWV